MTLKKALYLGCVVPIVIAFPVVAQEQTTPANPAASDQTTTENPAVDPAALAILDAMAKKLASADTISVKAHGQFDVPTADGQPIFYMTLSDVSMQRPDKLKVSVLGDGPKSEFAYDGRQISVYMPEENILAVGEAPGTVEEMLDKAYGEAGISFPYADFLIDDPLRSLTHGLRSAFVVGQSDLVGDTKTDIVAIANDDLQGQLWIGTEDKLPRLIWISPTQMDAKPRRAVEFTDWKLDQPIAENTFTTSDTGDATKIGMASPDAPPATTN